MTISIKIDGKVVVFPSNEALTDWRREQVKPLQDEATAQAAEELCRSYGYGRDLYQGD